MAIAYVIMPYAKEYERVYRNLIKPAIEKCGLECVRTDKDAKGGHVLSNVLKSIVDAQIVIADISAQNWNVSYELGVRHALSKKGTIILCNDSTELPFDIAGYEVITYATDWLDQNLDDEIIDRIVNRIHICQDATVASDSPVHDIFPTLPDNLVQYANSSDRDEQAQLKQMQGKIDELNKKNKALQELIDRAGLGEEDVKEKAESTEEQFRQAIENSKYISDTAVNTLHGYLNDGKKEEFAMFLSKVLDNGFLDVVDCKRVYLMCRKLDNPTIVRIFLERAVSYYPDNEELQGFLADTYSDDYRTREKALIMANAMIGLTKKNGKNELQPKLRSSRMIASFFNVYISLGLFKDMVDIGEKLLEQNPTQTSLIMRNIINANTHLEQYEKAEAVARTLIAQDPTDDQNHVQVFYLHNAMHNYVAAYKELEKCIACDNEDTNYYKMIAGLICDGSIARDSNGEYIRITKAEKEVYAVPFLIRAILIDESFCEQALNFMHNNKFQSSMQRLFVILQQGQGVEAIMEEFEGLDYSAVDACLDVDCTKWEED